MTGEVKNSNTPHIFNHEKGGKNTENTREAHKTSRTNYQSLENYQTTTNKHMKNNTDWDAYLLKWITGLFVIVAFLFNCVIH